MLYTTTVMPYVEAVEILSETDIIKHIEANMVTTIVSKLNLSAAAITLNPSQARFILHNSTSIRIAKLQLTALCRVNCCRHRALCTPHCHIKPRNIRHPLRSSTIEARMSGRAMSAAAGNTRTGGTKYVGSGGDGWGGQGWAAPQIARHAPAWGRCSSRLPG